MYATPIGQACYYATFPNSMKTTGILTVHADFDVFTIKFDMAIVNDGIKNNVSKNVVYL